MRAERITIERSPASAKSALMTGRPSVIAAIPALSRRTTRNCTGPDTVGPCRLEAMRNVPLTSAMPRPGMARRGTAAAVVTMKAPLAGVAESRAVPLILAVL